MPKYTSSKNSFAVAARPATNDGAALGVASTNEWSDLFLASGGVINWDNGDVTLTHATGTLTLAGGPLLIPDGTAAAPSLASANATTYGFRWTPTVNNPVWQIGATHWVRLSDRESTYGMVLSSTDHLAWAAGNDPEVHTGDLFLFRDAANTLAQRNGASAQTLRVYNGFTDASNYSGLDIVAGSSYAQIFTRYAGTGNATGLALGTNGTLRFTIEAATGHLLAFTDNTYDIGASGAARPRTVYAGTSINAAGATAFVASGANAQAANIKQITELHTLAAASTSDTTITFPANVLILGVSWRVTTEITGPTSFNIGDQDTPALYATGVALAAGTTGSSAGTTSAKITGGVRAIRFTGVGGGVSFTAGVIRVTGYYIDLTAPTS